MGDPETIDIPGKGRIVARVRGYEAELVYRVVGGRLLIVHTGVPHQLAGAGIGGKLVAAALEKAIEEGLTLVPQCPFATAWLRSHPDAAAKVTIDWSESR
jgi:predicted GNAT family acetyltransferase